VLLFFLMEGIKLRILFIGDIFGSPGRKAVKKMYGPLKEKYAFDYCIANAENAAAGAGITRTIAEDLYNIGVDAITMGNHTWSKKDINFFIDSDSRMARPANYPPDTPGNSSIIIDGKIGVINLLGRVYMDYLDCPFAALDRELDYLKQHVQVVIVDIHAEATSEKCALAWHADGRVSAVIGTHTHVQTADERILPRGTAFLTDAGMTGPHEGIIGVDKDIILEKFLKRMPVRFQVANGQSQFNGVVIEIDEKTGKAFRIERIAEVFDL
jgi:metallophosphoesterase (TIGR00282 family)